MMVKLADLLYAFEILNAGDAFDDQAYISLETGAICIVSKTMEIREGPEDIAESDKYLAIPGRRDLELGRKLVLSFVDQEAPDQSDVVYDIFSRKGAYAKFKQWLVAHRKLDAWYAFESRATEQALRDWCAIYGITVSEE